MARRSKKPKAPVQHVAGEPGVAPSIDPNVALFASYVEDDRRRARDAKREAREQRRAADESKRLVETKDAAAAELKRIRSRGGASAEDRAAAEAAYRDALAAVVEAETGSAPAWAPPPAASVEPAEAEGSDPAEVPGGDPAPTSDDGADAEEAVESPAAGDASS